jgi:hypothetical protein
LTPGRSLKKNGSFFYEKTRLQRKQPLKRRIRNAQTLFPLDAEHCHRVFVSTPIPSPEAIIRYPMTFSVCIRSDFCREKKKEAFRGSDSYQTLKDIIFFSLSRDYRIGIAVSESIADLA